ncbi:MAG: apolipoprotein N-acyltransferase [Kordiimonadaceae bacterium]|nr:apolipoprotein N-acyltransferase [Kordiimonadaceae bacterium]
MANSNLSLDSISDYYDRCSQIKKYLILLCAGLISALAFAPVYFFPALIIAYTVLLIFTILSIGLKQAFYYGLTFGFGHFFAGLYWIGNSFAVEPSIPDFAGYVLVALLSCYLAIFPGLTSVVVRYIHKNHSIKRQLLSIVLTFSVVWNIMEWFRGVLFTGFPWNLTGYVWGFSDAMLQSTSIWGVYGLGIFTVFIAIVPLLLLNRANRIVVSILSIILIAGLYLYGHFRLNQQTEYVKDINLRVVQANIKQEDKWPSRNWGKNLITYMTMSEGIEQSGTTHVIWPETAIIYSLSEEPLRRQVISKMLEKGGVVFTGFPRRDRSDGSFKIYNSMIAINDQGEMEAIYDKSHLVPLGEYIPSFVKTLFIALGFDQLFSGGQNFSEGDGLKTFNIKGLPPVGVLICYEIIFPGQVTDPSNRPDWLLNITNDAWYGNSSGPRQHLLQTRVRAIEEGLPVIRSAGTGISAVIDAYGRIIDHIDLNKRGVINSGLPYKIKQTTLYSIYKQWIFMLISVIISIVNIVLIRRFTP